MSDEEKQILIAHTDALNRNAAITERLLLLRERELKGKTGQKKRERSRYKDWLYSDEVVERLRPFINEVEVLKQMREQGLFDLPNEGYKLQGRTFFYNPQTVEKIRKRFDSNLLKPIRRR